jgi:hypothetical protein
VILTELRPHQSEALEAALPHRGFALFPEQRTGKCLISLALADRRRPDILVIVCPKKALRVWREQIEEHLRFDWSCTKILIHYEAMCRSARDRRWWRNRFRKTWADKSIFIIVDEGHRIKSRGSLQSTMIRSLGKESTWRLLLTGTPVDKVREDTWAIMDFVKPGALEDTWEEFSDLYLKVETVRTGNRNPNKPWADWRKMIVGYRNSKRFKRIFHRYFYRVTLRGAQRLGGRRPYRARRRVARFDLKPETRRIYNELETALVTEVRKKKVSTPLVVTLVSKLQQIAGGFLIHTEQVFEEDGTPSLTPRGRPKIVRTIIPVGREKLVRLVKLIKRYPRRKKIVICFRFRHEIERVGRQLERLGRSWKRIAGGDYFDGEFDTDTILLQIKSGEAIDLSAAKVFIMYSWDYSNISHEQAKFRILSFESDLVDYIYLIANESVDEVIYQAVKRKKRVTSAVIDKYRRKRA